MFGDWKVQIIESPGFMINRVYLMRSMAHGREFLDHTGTIHTIQEGIAAREDYYFAEMSDDVLQEFANTMARKGIRTTNDSKNEGLLEATSKHLEDMRKLVFKDSDGS